MKRLITLLGSLTMLGTVGATIGAWTTEVKTIETKEVDRSVLRQTIVNAIATLVASPQKSEAAKNQLISEIDKAKAILLDGDATQEQLDNAQHRLEEETQNFNNSPNISLV